MTDHVTVALPAPTAGPDDTGVECWDLDAVKIWHPTGRVGPPLVVMQIDNHIYEMLDDEADIIAAALLAAARSARADQTRSHQ